MPLSPDQFETAFDRVTCPGAHARPRFIVHSPGFYEEGPRFGVGLSTIACPACAEDVSALLTLQYGGAQVRQLG